MGQAFAYIMKYIKFDGLWLTRKIKLKVFDNSKSGVCIPVQFEHQFRMHYHFGIFKQITVESKLYYDTESELWNDFILFFIFWSAIHSRQVGERWNQWMFHIHMKYYFWLLLTLYVWSRDFIGMYYQYKL